METTAFTESMKEFVQTAATCFTELELAAKDLLSNPVRPLDNTKYSVTVEKSKVLSEEEIEQKVIESAKRSKSKIPSEHFTKFIKEKTGLTTELANECIQKLLKEGKIEAKEAKERKPKEKTE